MGDVQANPSLLGYQVRAEEEGKTAEQLFEESLRKVSPGPTQPHAAAPGDRLSSPSQWPHRPSEMSPTLDEEVDSHLCNSQGDRGQLWPTLGTFRLVAHRPGSQGRARKASLGGTHK